MNTETNIWLTPDDVRSITVYDHDATGAPGLVQVKLGDGVWLNLVAEGGSREGDGLEALALLRDRLTYQLGLAEGQRYRRAAEAEAVDKHETDSLIDEAEKREPF